MKNTGKSAEGDFEDRLRRIGKAAYWYRLKDAADIRGLTGKIGHVDKQPSDYVIVVRGLPEFAEVKSTNNQTSFPFSLLKTGQMAHAARIIAAGGAYCVYVKRLATEQWYRVPYQVIRAVQDAGASSIPWTKLGDFLWIV